MTTMYTWRFPKLGQLLALAAALLVGATASVFAHGYGTRPPWVNAGVVRVLGAEADVYLEVHLQHAGHIGTRGALSFPDTFQIVRTGARGVAHTTARWKRERGRRALAAGDEVLGRGVLAGSPCALAVLPAGTGLAFAERAGVAVQEPDGGLRFHTQLERLFDATQLASWRDEHGRNAIWPFRWLDAPPRTIGLWAAGDTLAVALRADDGRWHLASLRASDGAPLGEAAAWAVLAENLAAPGAPEASIALEVLALAHGRPEARLEQAAEAVASNTLATREARLLAAALRAQSAQSDDARALAREPLIAQLEGGDGHPSMDDLLAAAALVDLVSVADDTNAPTEAPAGLSPTAPATAGASTAGPAMEGLADPEGTLARRLGELALARGVPELLPALAALGAAGVAPLADHWLAAREGRTSPYVDARASAFGALRGLVLALRSDAAAVAALGAWLDAGSDAVDAAQRGALLGALMECEPADALGDGRRSATVAGVHRDVTAPEDLRAQLVRALGANDPLVFEVGGAGTRDLVGALVEALGRAAARGDEARGRLAASALVRVVDVPPPGSLSADEDLGALARRWSHWWQRAAERPQAGELAALLEAVSGELVQTGAILARPGFGEPHPALAEALVELLEAGGGDTWRVLDAVSPRWEDELDSLGLRGLLRRALAQIPALDDAEWAARRRIERAIQGSTTGG